MSPNYALLTLQTWNHLVKVTMLLTEEDLARGEDVLMETHFGPAVRQLLRELEFLKQPA